MSAFIFHHGNDPYRCSVEGLIHAENLPQAMFYLKGLLGMKVLRIRNADEHFAAHALGLKMQERAYRLKVRRRRQAEFIAEATAAFSKYYGSSTHV